MQGDSHNILYWPSHRWLCCQSLPCVDPPQMQQQFLPFSCWTSHRLGCYGIPTDLLGWGIGSIYRSWAHSETPKAVESLGLQVFHKKPRQQRQGSKISEQQSSCGWLGGNVYFWVVHWSPTRSFTVTENVPTVFSLITSNPLAGDMRYSLNRAQIACYYLWRKKKSCERGCNLNNQLKRGSCFEASSKDFRRTPLTEC